MPSFSQSDLDKLDMADLRHQLVCKELIKYVQFKIIETHRNEVDQNAAFDRGASKLRWPNGKHNSLPAKAIDIAPTYFEAGAKINWEDACAFARLAGWYEAIAASKGFKIRLGMDWDGDWRTAGKDPGETFLDLPHIEVVD